MHLVWQLSVNLVNLMKCSVLDDLEKHAQNQSTIALRGDTDKS